jgi:hypothetical protein
MQAAQATTTAVSPHQSAPVVAVGGVEVEVLGTLVMALEAAVTAAAIAMAAVLSHLQDGSSTPDGCR